MMKLFQVLLPYTDRSGTPIRTQTFEQLAIDTCGNFTRYPSVDVSQMCADGLLRERFIPYHMACTEDQFLDVMVETFAANPHLSVLQITDFTEARLIHREPKQRMPAPRMGGQA